MRENLEMPVLLSAWGHMYSASSVIILREKDTKVGERHEPNNPWQRGPHVDSRCAGWHDWGNTETIRRIDQACAAWGTQQNPTDGYADSFVLQTAFLTTCTFPLRA